MKKILILFISIMMIGCSQNTMNNHDLVVDDYLTGNQTEVSQSQDIYLILTNLDYHSTTCDGMVEYVFTFETGDCFQINLSDKWVWYENKEATLNDDTIVEIQALLNNEST